MGQISVEISQPSGSLLSGNQQLEECRRDLIDRLHADNHAGEEDRERVASLARNARAQAEVQGCP